MRDEQVKFAQFNIWYNRMRQINDKLTFYF